MKEVKKDLLTQALFSCRDDEKIFLKKPLDKILGIDIIAFASLLGGPGRKKRSRQARTR